MIRTPYLSLKVRLFGNLLCYAGLVLGLAVPVVYGWLHQSWSLMAGSATLLVVILISATWWAARQLSLRPSEVITTLNEQEELTQQVNELTSKLNQTQEWLSRAFFSNPVPLSVTDFESRIIIEVNDSFERLSGYNRAELVGSPPAAFDLDFSAEEAGHVYDRLQKDGTIRNYETTIQFKDGKPRAILGAAELIELAGRTCVLWAHQDISARLQAETNLRLSEERFATAFHSNPCAMSIVRLSDGAHLDVNEKWLRALQMERADVIGRTGIELPVWREPSDREMVYELLRTQGSINGLELTMHSVNGQEPTGLISAEIITLGGERCALFIVQDITERKLVEAALRDQEDRLHLAMQAAGLGMWEFNVTEWRGYWTPEFANLFGSKPEDFDGSPEAFYRMIHPEDKVIIQAAFERVLKGEVVRDVEYRRLMPDGSYQWHTSLGRLFLDESGNAQRVIGVSMNITDRKRAEAVLLDRETRLRLSLQAARMGTWVFDVVQGRGEWSPEYEAIYGLEPGAYDGSMEAFFARVHPDDARSVRRDFRRGMKSDSVWQIDFRYYHEDGSLRWQSNLGRMVHDADGRVMHVIGVGMDVTERKQAEQALQEREARLRLSMQVAGLGTWDLDWNEQRGSFSPEYEALFGLTPGEYDGSPAMFLRMVHPEDVPIVLQTFSEATPEKPQHAKEIRLIQPDGSVRWHLSMGRMFFDKQGKRTRAIGVGLDITERKDAEQALQTSQRQLSQLAARLQKAREDERAEMARNIHDELGQSMTGLKFILKWLEPQLTSEQAAARAKVTEMLDTVSATIDQIRRVATALRPGILDDFGLVAALEWQAQEFQLRTSITCRLSVKPNETAIQLLERDRATAFFRIFQEALTNVARHAQARTVDAQLFMQEGDVILLIHDDGRGITAEELSNAHSLGLLGMRERAQMFDGTFNIAPTQQGTLVTVRIPFRSQESSPSDVNEQT